MHKNKIFSHAGLGEIERRVMAGKFYAVKEVKKQRNFESWIDCKKQVDGYSGAKYKSFKSRKEAMEYLDSTKEHVQMMQMRLRHMWMEVTI